MAILVNPLPPCILFEDEHLLVVNKPAGMNTHAPGPYAGEGIYDWLRHREPRWAGLAIIHRLDKETSGVIVFGKTTIANRSLTEQFTQHTIRKKYLLLTDRPVKRGNITAVSTLVRSGEKYLSRPLHAGGDRAETRFHLVSLSRRSEEAPSAKSAIRNPQSAIEPFTSVEAEPVTGRTHQIRVHAAEHGFPVLGDTLYGGTRWQRVCLHAAELVLKHPATGQPMTFSAPVDFSANSRAELRRLLIDAEATTAWRVLHGAADGCPNRYLEKFGDYLLVQSEEGRGDVPLSRESEAGIMFSGVYHKTLTRHVRQTSKSETCPRLISGAAAAERFVILENGVKYELSFAEGYSAGLFLDQRDNRRRLLTGHVAAGFTLGGSSSEDGAPKLSGARTAMSASPLRNDVPLDIARKHQRADSAVRAPGFGQQELTSAAGKMEGLELLNVFAYTCGFSVCAALGGARTTSLDLSEKISGMGQTQFCAQRAGCGQARFYLWRCL